MAVKRRKKSILGFRKNQAVVLVELLIVMAIITTALAYLLALAGFYLKNSLRQKTAAQALYLTEGILEGVRSFRDNTFWSVDGLGTLNNGALYHLEKNEFSRWVLVLGEQTTGRFTESVVLREAVRDGNGNITEGPGLSDPDTKIAEATVSWTERGELVKVALKAVFANWR